VGFVVVNLGLLWRIFFCACLQYCSLLTEGGATAELFWWKIVVRWVDCHSTRIAYSSSFFSFCAELYYVEFPIWLNWQLSAKRHMFLAWLKLIILV